MFMTLAERLAEPLATKDRALARAIAADGSLDIEVIRL
jgi:predicted nucleic acid-binding protein